MAFQNAIELCQKNGLDVKKSNPAFGFLRFETNIVDGANTYSFSTISNETYNGIPQSPTEVRLQLQDNFVAASKGFYLQWWNMAINRPVTQLLTCLSFFNATVNNTQVPAWNTTLDQADEIKVAAQQFWQSGWMKYTFDNNVLIPRWDMMQHYLVAQTQQNWQTLAVGGDAPYPYTANIQQMDGSSDGWVPIEPNIVLSGAKNNEIVFNNPTAPRFADMGWLNVGDAGFLQPKLVVMYRGILLQNTTNVK